MSEAQGLGTALTGSLTLGCFSVLAPYVLPEIHATCAERYPGLRLVTREEDLDELAAGVLSGRFELGLGYNLEPDARLAMTSVFALPPYLLVPAGHRLAGRRKVRLEQLGGEPLALLDLPQSREYFLGLFAAAGIEPNVRYRTTSVETARALVGLGLACTLLNLRPKMSTSLDGHEVVPVALAGDSSALDVVMLTAAAWPPDPPCRGGGRPVRRGASPARLLDRPTRWLRPIRSVGQEPGASGMLKTATVPHALNAAPRTAIPGRRPP